MGIDGNLKINVLPGRELGQPRFTAIGSLRGLHVHLTLAGLLHGHRIPRMTY